MIVALGLALALAALVATGCGGGRQTRESFGPSWSPDGRQLLFWVNPDRSCQHVGCAYDYEVWISAADGDNPRKLARGTWPAWSPDGRTIAFARLDLLGRQHVYTVRGDGSRIGRLKNVTGRPVWSPDGRRIALLDYPALSVLGAADGARPHRLTRLSTLEASWSPDGEKIAFTTLDRPGLYTIGVDGHGLKRLFAATYRRMIERSIAWSPDGRKIAFDVGGNLAVVTTDGRLLVSPARQRVGAWDPSWSPDGRKIAFEAPGGGVYTVDADGTGRKRLTTTAARDRGAEPTWSPNGRRIVFQDGGDICVIGADGSGRRTISD